MGTYKNPAGAGTPGGANVALARDGSGSNGSSGRTLALILRRRALRLPHLELGRLFAYGVPDWNFHIVVLNDGNGGRKRIGTFRSRRKAIDAAVKTAFLLRLAFKGRGSAEFQRARRTAYRARQRRIAARARRAQTEALQ